MNIRLLLLPIISFSLLSCTEESSPYIEPSILQDRIDSGYFAQPFVDDNNNPLDLSHIIILIKHYYSVEGKFIVRADFQEFDKVKEMEYTYISTKEGFAEDYRIEIHVSLLEDKSQEYYINSVTSLVNNIYVYDAWFNL